MSQASLVFAITADAPTLPAIADRFQMGQGALALAGTVYGISFGGLLIPASNWVQKVGKCSAILWGGLTIFVVGGVLSVLPFSQICFPLGRLIQGAGGALAAPAMMAFLPEVASGVIGTKGDSGKAMALWGMVSPAGAIAGVTLSGLIVDYTSWYGPLLIPIFFLFLSLVAMYKSIPHQSGNPSLEIDWAASFTLLASVALLDVGLSLIVGASKWFAVSSLVAGVLMFVLFYNVEKMTARPLVLLVILRDRTWVVPFWIAFLGVTFMSSSFFFVSLFLQQNIGAPAKFFSLVLLPAILVQIVSIKLVPSLISRLSVIGTTYLGIGVLSVALLVMGAGF